MDRLYQLYSKAIFGIISSSCADVKVAEEILQVSFSTIWEKISDFEPISAPTNAGPPTSRCKIGTGSEGGVKKELPSLGI